MSSNNLLSYVRTRVTVDVDSMDPDVAARHTGDQAGAKFSDMTSNQAIVYNEIIRPQRADVFKTAIAQIRATESQLDIETQVSDAVDLIVSTTASSMHRLCMHRTDIRVLRPI